MKKIIIAIALLAGFQHADAQADTLLPYQKFPSVPPFDITKVPDSIKFTKDDLKKKKPTMIFVFNPDCSHCQHAIKDLLDNYSLFEKVQIVMASPMDVSFIKKFYNEYKIADHPNITMGRDYSFFFGSFYGIHSFPSVYIYNKKGKLVEEFKGSFDVKKAAAAL